MSQYQPPLRDIGFLLKHVFPLDHHARQCGIELDTDTALAVADEAGKFAKEMIYPATQTSPTKTTKSIVRPMRRTCSTSFYLPTSE